MPGTHSASKDDLDCCSTSSSGTSCTPRLVPGHRMWADKNGRHVLGLIEDYNALRKQISEGQQVLGEMEVTLREVAGTKLQEPGIKVSCESTSCWVLPTDAKCIDYKNNQVNGAAGTINFVTQLGYLNLGS